ncbi:MAG: isoleucyl-tRNA synthetase [Candidatus Peregrinibacteria bacterium Greene0416_19]|nr:MAG: isoleucyl-tRNA synthetase [Candidatus Peregrinibacteria bacterium Greene0416_19]
MFDPVDPRQSFPALERGILQYWQEEDTFKRSIRNRSKVSDLLAGPTKATREQTFGFYDGPPFATGLPHYGHLLAGTIKDVIPRYQTMRGKSVQRRFGWDCHGLPVEYEIEKEHGITSRKEIEEMGVAAFNKLCRTAVQRYTKEWRVTVERMGRWVDMDWDYRTMDPDYMESIWWVFQSLYDKGLVYEGHRPMHICPRCQTPLSNFEVTQGYKEITDHSVTAMFELEDEPGTFLLAWTTTPWTLPGNLFLAAHPEVEYIRFMERGKENTTYIASHSYFRKVLEPVNGKTTNERQFFQDGAPFKGTELFGKLYKPLFPYFADIYKESAFRIVTGDFVTTEDGTGVVHIAPGFGEDDYNTGKHEGVPLLQHVGMDGKLTSAVTDFAEMEVKPKDDPTKADRKIADYLKEKGLLFAEEKYKHSYPHCWRCDSPLLNYATSSWFVAVEQIKEDMLKANAMTQWVPSHIRDGRFGKWLEGARDWAISRSRYWGTPLPIWRCEHTGETVVLGSRDEVMARTPDRFTKVTVLRHAESEANVTPRYQGKVPGSDLTENGRKQATAVATAVARRNVNVIYCSPLARTIQTAEAIAKKTKAKMIVDERLREVEFGEYEGKAIDWSDLSFVRARRAHKLESGSVESIYHFPGMETWAQVQERIAGFLQETLPKHKGQHVIIVTHADPALNIKHYLTKEDPAKLCDQPYPRFAVPKSYFFDHETQAELDLHKETVDTIRFPAGTDADVVHLTLVRHGQSTENEVGVLSGKSDPSLTDKGREQALDLLRQLKSADYDVILSSPLLRARETADIVAKRWGMDLGTVDLFREQDLGDWERKTEARVREEHPDYPRDFLASVTRIPNGESQDVFHRRLRQALAMLLERYRGKRVLVFAHRRVMNAIHHLECGGPIWRPIENTAVESYALRPMFERIPEVLDCWFESGSMPYAQSHFPFEMAAKETRNKNQEANRIPIGFPADFIAEGIDQTRGWFYTLTVLAAALFQQPAFHHCIVNGTILAEDGKKMSKRLKNYPEPLEVMEKQGADAVRFALMSSPAVRGEDMRFSEKSVEEALRNVLLPLWNTYSFFVTYANAAGWQPQETRTHSQHPLDRWIRAEVQDLVNRMTEELEHYDLSATCGELHETIDALTNWYVRLSRRRFAGKTDIHNVESEQGPNMEERTAALATLYDVLLTISQLLAPFCPFLTEAMYLNLVPQEHGSVHLTDWPEMKKLKKEETQLQARQNLLRRIVSLGLSVRADKKIKIRQPLASATIAIPTNMNKGKLDPGDIRLLQEELNVKAIDCVDDPGALAEAYAQVDARTAGPRLGAKVQEVIQAGKRGAFTMSGKNIIILDETLSPEEAQVIYRGKEGQDVAADYGIVVSLDTRITPELAREGSARDLIRAIQKLRKESGYDMGERIALGIEGADDLLKEFGELVMQETNTSIDAAKRDGKRNDVTLDDLSIAVFLDPKK